MGSKLALMGLGVACAVSLLALLSRQAALDARLDVLERRRPPSPAAPVRSAEEVPVDPRVDVPASRNAPPREGPAAAPPREPEAFTPAQRAAVSREVERALRERRGSLAAHAFPPVTDVPSLLEKELGLSPAQKLKIEELWKRREEELMKLAGSGPGEGGFQDFPRKIQAAEARWDETIKRELDFAQGQTYDRLRKEGRLHAGVMIQVDFAKEK
jgi:hypothetical protein